MRRVAKMRISHTAAVRLGTVRSLYMTTFQAIVAIGVVCMIAPPTWEDLTHLAISGLVDSSNEVWREGTDLASVAREF